ncbi:MAG: hypothetical protein RL011_2238 [Pseudomonadota bacterium]|jgi:uncharacterized protein YecA (UPF0149 family)
MTEENQGSEPVKLEKVTTDTHVHGPGCQHHHHHHHQVETYVRAEPKVGRNDPCPCGSGKKSKKCCH